MDIDIKGWVRPHKPVRDRVPIYAAAMREGMCRMAGDVADGLIGHPMCPVRWLDEVVIPSFETGLQRSGRQRSDLDFIPTITTIIDDDEARALDAGPPHDRLLLDSPHLQAALGDARLRRRRRGGRRCLPQGRPRRRPGADSRRDGGGVHGGRPTRQGARARSPRSPSAATESCSTPATYFIPPEQIGEYQAEDHRGLRPGVSGQTGSFFALVGEAVDERLELLRVAQRGAVAEADQLRLECRQPAC